MRKSSKFEDEIRMEQDERKREEEEKRERQQAFKERAALFNAKWAGKESTGLKNGLSEWMIMSESMSVGQYQSFVMRLLVTSALHPMQQDSELVEIY